MVSNRSTLTNRKGHSFSRHDFAASPLIVFYETTQACDLVCQHCRACAQTRPHSGELCTKESKQLIAQLSEFPKPPMLVLTGGDPLKRADIYELVAYSRKRGLQVSITPSATPLLTRDALKRLRDAGIERVALSLDGANAATHDDFRGVVGSYERTLEALIMAQSLGIPVQVNSTITPANAAQVDDMAELLADQDIVLWSVFFVVSVGRGDAMQRLTTRQYAHVFERLWDQSHRQPYVIKTTEAPHYRRFVLQNRACEEDGSAPRFETHGVNDGKGVMFIGHTGFVYPSGFMPILCGVFPEQHVVDIYQRSPVMQKLRDPDHLEGKCGACGFRRVCGGSRARAYAVTGNPFAQEPDCWFEPSGWAELTPIDRT